MLLHDAAPIDIAVSITFGIALIAVLRGAVLGFGASRWSWITISLILLALLVNQQSDAHVFLIRAGARALEAIHLEAHGQMVLAVCAAALGAVSVAVASGLVFAARAGYPPGTMGLVGLALLSLHVIGRTARLVHVFRGPWADVPLTLILKASELVGLALLSVAAWRWQSGPQRQPITGT